MHSISLCHGSDLPHELNKEWNEDLDKAAALFKNLMQGDVSIEDAVTSDALQRIKEQLTTYTKSLKQSSRTSALWLQYMDMLDILRKYIRSERTGKWNLHLQAIQEMLPYVVPSGHNLHTKFLRLYVYVQQMSDLAITFATKSSVKIGGDEVQIDQLLYQGLITAVKTTEDLESAFKCKLCSYPSALCESSMLLREPHKPALADASWQLVAWDA